MNGERVGDEETIRDEEAMGRESEDEVVMGRESEIKRIMM